MNNKLCYKCKAKATSREHVPPLCLFPEKKDLNENYNFRKDLITVPSCYEHNLKKSNDDEFLMASLSGVLGNNYIGFYHNRTKVLRALERKIKLREEIVKDPQFLTVTSKDGKVFPLTKGTPDLARLTQCFENIAYGIYCWEFKEQFEGKATVVVGFVNYRRENDNKMCYVASKKFDIETKELEYKGKNPEVFKYLFAPPDEYGIISLKMIFYEYAEIFAVFLKKGMLMPKCLPVELIHEGIKTIIEFEDESIEFN